MGYLPVTLWVTYIKLLGPKKKLSKHINMGASFKDLDASSLTVKTDFESDKRFELQNILNLRFFIELAC